MDSDKLRNEFEKHVQRGFSCWKWVGHRKVKRESEKSPYGTMYVEGKEILAHRASWILAFGPIPKGKLVLHKCDNPICTNPYHLFLGTQSDNMLDCAKKGRHVAKRNREKFMYKGGGLHGRNKLSDGDVVFIKQSDLSSKNLATMFDVSYQQIDHIRAGRSRVLAST